MKLTRRSVRIVGLVLVLVALVAVPALGVRGFLARPTAVATVSVSRVMEALNQRAAAEAELREMAVDMQGQDTVWTGALERLRNELKEIPAADIAARRAKEEETAQQALEMQAWRMFATEQIDIEKSLMLRELDRSIKASIAQLAQSNGWDIVLIDDSKIELVVDAKMKASREDQVKLQLRTRRIIFADPMVDITDELIERMNNAFNAGG